MKKFLKNKKALIASSLCLLIFITGAFAFMVSESNSIRNIFTVGSVGVKLTENFNGETLEGGKTEDGETLVTEIQCAPNATYQKEIFAEFTGKGEAFVYLKVEIPYLEVDIVDENGESTGEKQNAVQLNYSDDFDPTGITRDKGWALYDRFNAPELSQDGKTLTYVFMYKYNVNEENPKPETSPIDSVSIANMVIRDNDLILDENGNPKSYDVKVTAYALQDNGRFSDAGNVWRNFVNN